MVPCFMLLLDSGQTVRWSRLLGVEGDELGEEVPMKILVRPRELTRRNGNETQPPN